jgi:hypothetical protein
MMTALNDDYSGWVVLLGLMRRKPLDELALAFRWI